MKLLLDTHVFLWLNLEPEKCTPKVLDLCQQPETILLLSMASLWEIQIKHQLGKLPLDVALRTLIETSQAEYGLQFLSIAPEHIYGLESLPNHHRDPFDRLLVAQAKAEALPLVSADQHIARYPIEVVW